MYGQFHTERDRLPGFYNANGFEVLPEDGGVDLWVVFGHRVVLHGEVNERLFYCWRRDLRPPFR